MLEVPKMNPSKLKESRRELREKSTEAEEVLWRRLRNSRLGVKFSRQVGIENFITDFCSRTLKLIIEVDGPIHQKKDFSEHDKFRSDVLEGFGYKILRFTNEQVLKDIDSVIKIIKTEIFSPPSLGGGEEPRSSASSGGKG
ncbi:MAG: endonuclease domain-containing protein [Patescibacteria group bacterium]|jgi:very-short-patch-repair endonuclease